MSVRRSGRKAAAFRECCTYSSAPRTQAASLRVHVCKRACTHACMVAGMIRAWGTRLAHTCAAKLRISGDRVQTRTAQRSMSTTRSRLYESAEDVRVPVHLNVYDLILPQVPDWTVSALYNVGVGFFHSGVAVYGTEYCFGGHTEPTTGVFEVPPRDAPAAKFRECVVVGYTALSPIDVALLVNQMAAADIWRGNSYNLLSRNCNHFASDLCEKLTGNQAPSWINRLAWMGERAKFLLPEGIDTPMAAPVQAPHVRDAQQHAYRDEAEADPDVDD